MYQLTQLVCTNDYKSTPRQLTTGVLQGSVLGPILFCIHTLPLRDIVRRHGVSFHFYADDTQLYMQFRPSDLPVAVQCMDNCVADIREWMTANYLKLNEDKTEYLILGTKQKIGQCDMSNASLSVGDMQTDPVNSARNIGVLFDSNMSLVGHINNTRRSVFYQLRNTSKISRFLDNECCLQTDL